MRNLSPIEFSLAMLLCLVCCALACAQTGDSAQFELSDGSSIEGRLKSIDGDLVTVESDGKEKVLPCETLVVIRSQTSSRPEGPVNLVTLVDGSLLHCKSVVSADRKLQLTTENECQFNIDSRVVDFVQFQATAGQQNSLWRDLLAEEREGDALVVNRDKKLQMVDGIIGNISDKSVSFTAGERSADVKRERLAGLLFYRRYSDKQLPPKFIVELTDGSKIRAQSLATAEAKVMLVSMCGAEMSLGVDAISNINFSEGRAVWLTNVDPASNNWSPLLASSSVLAKLKEFSIARFDRDFSGNPLEMLVLNEETGSRVRRSYSRGIAIKGGGKLSYVVAQQYQKLTGLVGFDPSANSAGVVKFVIQVDGENQLEEVLKAAEMDRPLAIEVDLSGASRIVFEVGYHDRRGVGDILHAVEMKLHR